VGTLGGLLASSEAKTDFAELSVPGWAWGAVLGFMTVLLIIDLFVLHPEPKVLPFRRAAIEWVVWMVIGLGFTVVVLLAFNGDAASEYVSGYLIEKSLSVDNVFVWALIFSSFSVPMMYQHRVLFWGVFGALVLRAAFIFAGVALLERFEWVLFVFGGFLVFTALKLAVKGEDEEEFHPEKSRFLRIIRRVVPTSPTYHGQKLFIRENGKRLATPLFAVLLLVEGTDVVFAVDSVPAVLAVSREQFIVFSSNAFAILGLRSMYFLLADMRARFSYLQEGLAIILGFVGVKMVISKWVHIDTWISLLVIVMVLVMSILFSMQRTRRAGAIDSIEEIANLPESGPSDTELGRMPEGS